MHRRLDDLVQFIVREMTESQDRTRCGKRLRDILAVQGYEDTEIDTAFKMASAEVLKREPADRVRPVDGGLTLESARTQTTYRVLAPWERVKLTLDAQDVLMWLESEGLLWPEEREEALSECMKVEGTVDAQELTELILYYIFAPNDPRRHVILLECDFDTDIVDMPIH